MTRNLSVIFCLSVLGIILFAPFSAWLDLEVSSFFHLGEGEFHKSPLLDFIYIYGALLSVFIGTLSACSFVMSFIFVKWIRLRLPTLYITLVLIFGPGLLVNLILKEHWGRPRPKEVEQFGGKHTFHPFWKPNRKSPGHCTRSFPSGHAASGFFFISLIIAGRRHKLVWLKRTGIVLTLISCPSLMYARVAQGGHFLSDVLFSGVLMLWVLIWTDYLLHSNSWWSIQLRKRLLALPENFLQIQRPH